MSFEEIERLIIERRSTDDLQKEAAPPPLMQGLITLKHEACARSAWA